MYSDERRQEILRAIEHDSRVTVAELAARFGVSRVSVRRDLNDLSHLGLLKRTYGGAIRPQGDVKEPPFLEREVEHREEKERIGRAAAALVKPGETVFIDGGTTTQCMLGHLAKVPKLTVVTWGLNIVNGLFGLDNVEIIVLGGTLHRPSQNFSGVLAVTCMEAYDIHCDQAFLAARAVSAVGGVTNANFEEIPIKRKAVEVSREVVLLTDSSKIGHRAAGLIVPTHRVHRLVTGHEAPLDEVERLRQLGIVVDLV
jgi:DeoR family transcriptional regulator, aga operon transcriptional repressor